MAVYYQHIGRELWRRDAPRSIGTDHGLVRFVLADIEDELSDLQPSERHEILAKISNKEFQIWGFPSGASAVLQSATEGDHLLLLESEDFRYVGTILHYVREPLWSLSARIWGEHKFPLIALLQGELIEYPWLEFVRDFDFAPNYHMRGNTARLADARLVASRFGSEESFVQHLVRASGHEVEGKQMREFRTIEIDLDVHRRIELTRRSFAETPNIVLRRLLEIDESVLAAPDSIPVGQRDLRPARQESLHEQTRPGMMLDVPVARQSIGNDLPTENSVIAELDHYLLMQVRPVTPAEAYRALADKFGITYEQRTRRMASSDEVHWENRVRQARRKLVNAGRIDGDLPRGLWAIKKGK